MESGIEEITVTDTQEQETLPETRRPFSNVPWRKIATIVLGVSAVLGVIVGVPLFKAYQDARVVYAMLLGVKDAVKAQDLGKVKEEIARSQRQTAVLQGDLRLVGWTQFVPVLGGYTSDAVAATEALGYGLEAGAVVVSALEPYADILGFKGQGSFTGGTAEQRIEMMVVTLDKVIPQIDSVADKIHLAAREVKRVNPKNYPEKIFGRSVRPFVQTGKDIVGLTDDLLTSARPMVRKLPALLGVGGEKKYLVLFQNDKELRPTGGFITAYAIFRIEKGKVHLNVSDDIYKLDDTVTKHVTPPEPISKYLNVYGWRLRDANFSPDFYSSMRTFMDIYANSTRKEDIEGIIVVDTHFLVTLMEVLGPVDLYGMKFTTDNVAACNCPMVVYELLQAAGTPRGYWVDNRKDMIGMLLSKVMEKAMGSPRQIYGNLFQKALQAAREKHVLLYLQDEEAQKGVEALGFAGRIKTSEGDYLHVNDANLAGAKSNLYVVPTVVQNITVFDDRAEETLTLEYRYPHDADNCSLERKEGLCLAGIYRDYLRVYLPKGVVISQVRGFESKSQTFEDLDHTVVDGFFTVVPQGLAKIQIKYKVPGTFKKSREYRSLIQKQPGTVGTHYTVTVNGKTQEFDLTEDKEIVVKL